MLFRQLLAITAGLLLALAGNAHAEQKLDPVSQRYIEMLSNGGPTTIRDTARSMANSGESNPQVLDVAAEVLLRDYKESSSATVIDAMAWVSKALANAKTNRYQPVLQEVADNAGHRKLAGHAKKNLNKRLPDDKPYVKGSVKLEQVAKASASAAPAAASTPADGKYSPISVVREGMSMNEAYALVGQPTAIYQHQTGKAWVPFNVAGSDVVRQVALYKGQGRIVFSLVSTYSNVWKVVEVTLDKNESGYP